MKKQIQAKHLADAAILTIVDLLAAKNDGKVTRAALVAAFNEERAGLDPIPEKIIVAKLAAFLRRGELLGCLCGCEGNFRRNPRYDVEAFTGERFPTRQCTTRIEVTHD